MDTLRLHAKNGSSRLIQSLIGVVAILLFSYPASVVSDDGIVVEDGFEEDAISAHWDPPVIFGSTKPYGSISRTTIDPYSGDSALQFNWFASNTSSVSLHKGLPKLNEFYLRYAVKWSRGFQFTPGETRAKKVWRVWVSDSKDDIVFITKKKASTVASGHKFALMLNRMFREGHNPNLEENVGSPTTIETEKWYCFDWHVVGGMGTGLVEGWINGVKKWDYPNLYTASAPMTRFDLGGNISPDRPTINQTEWFDNVSLSGTPIVKGDVPACMSSTSSPLTPKGLGIS